MVSSIHGNAGWPPASHPAQVGSRETLGEIENDGDSDDVAGAVKATAPKGLPEYLGSRVDTLA